MQPPADWPTVDPRLIRDARERVERVLSDEARTAHELALLYAPDGDYAGPVFDDRADVDPNEIAAADLLAITAMQVQASPRALGRFLKDESTRVELRQSLAAVPDVPPWEASAAHLRAGAALYELVKRQFSDGNMWVTASKLCARKRPQLIPVRDSVIAARLGLPHRDYRQDWLIIGSVMEDVDVRARLRRCGEAADPVGSSILARAHELRLLDAVLWMRWSSGGRRRAATRSPRIGTAT